MKFLCPTCERLAYASGARVSGDKVLVICGRCGAVADVEIVEDAAPAAANNHRSRFTPAAPSPTPPTSSQPVPPPPPPPVSPPPSPPESSSTNKVVAIRAVTDAVRLAAEAAKAPDPFAVPEDRCPKCVAEKSPTSLACPHCGLVYVNYVPEETAPSSELATAFREAMERWDDTRLQDRALAIATRRGELVALGRLYRLRQAAAPLDPVAQRGRDEVLRRASAASEALRSSQAAAPRSRFFQRGGLIFLCLVLAVMFGMLVRQLLRT